MHCISVDSVGVMMCDTKPSEGDNSVHIYEEYHEQQ